MAVIHVGMRGNAAAPRVAQPGNRQQACREPAAGVVLAHQVVRRARVHRAHLRRRQRRAGRQFLKAVEEEELAHQEHGVHRCDRIVGRALNDQNRNAGFRAGGSARFPRHRIGPGVDRPVGHYPAGVMGVKRRAAGDGGMERGGGEESGHAQGQRGGERAARRQAGQVNAPCVDAKLLDDLGGLRRDDRRLAQAARGAPVEPVPAALGVRHPRLPRQQHDEAALIGKARDARARGECLGLLPAAMDPDHQRGELDGLEVARQVEQVFAPRRRQGDTQHAVQAGLAAEREASGRGRPAPQQRGEPGKKFLHRRLRLRQPRWRAISARRGSGSTATGCVTRSSNGRSLIESL